MPLRLRPRVVAGALRRGGVLRDGGGIRRSCTNERVLEEARSSAWFFPRVIRLNNGTIRMNAFRSYVVIRKGIIHPNTKVALLLQVACVFNLVGLYSTDVLQLRTCFFLNVLIGTFGTAYFNPVAPYMLILPFGWGLVWLSINGYRMSYLVGMLEPAGSNVQFASTRCASCHSVVLAVIRPWSASLFA